MKKLAVAVIVSSVAAAQNSEVEQSALPPPPPPARRVGGHVGLVAPLVTAKSSGFTSIEKGFVFGVTCGVGLNIVGPLTIDAELVTLMDTANRVVNVVVHPGVLLSLPWGFTTGVRGAWETQGAWGLTALLNKGFKVASNVIYVEAAFPVRWALAQQDAVPSFTFALHVGVGF